MTKLRDIHVTITEGYRAASGLGENGAYPEATLKMQDPFFKERGFDMAAEIPDLYWGTLNLNFSPLNFGVQDADYCLKDVKWSSLIAPEHFSFVKAEIVFNDVAYEGYVYYPHPETKPTSVHAHSYEKLEFLTRSIPDIAYGSTATLRIRESALVTMDNTA